MHELIKELHDLTMRFAGMIDDVKEEEVQGFLIRREHIFHKLQLIEMSESDRTASKEAVSEILHQDVVILAKLESIKQSIGMEIEKISLAKKQRSVYDAYLQSDGIYIDRRN
ncbi:hypothetical protein MO973_24445 [Paenibacillus sp. TRM 82003]|nr:hypothetical protein [Paenibacillus sp. TRM 82003]MCI3923381.1 hypothetical protein [Paenibacillus sp. TRM 82003]